MQGSNMSLRSMQMNSAPSGSRQGLSQSGNDRSGNDRATDLDQLNDPTALAGVDLKDEEQKMRNAAKAGQAKMVSLGRQRVHLNSEILQQAVVKIGDSPSDQSAGTADLIEQTAANYGLRYLEPDTLPMLALAIQLRLKTLVRSMVEARDHRASTNFLRPPPNYDGDFEQTGEWAPMWDEIMYDDVGKVLTTYDQIERAEERRMRIERTARDAAEREEQAAKEAAEAAAKVTEPEPTTKKAKKEKAKQTITDQQSHELMQRTALAQLGGPKLPAWAMGNVASQNLGSSKNASFGLDGIIQSISAVPPPEASSVVPLQASIDRNRLPPDTLDSAVTWRDAVYALERERGGGGMAGGARALHSAHARRASKRAATES